MPPDRMQLRRGEDEGYYEHEGERRRAPVHEQEIAHLQIGVVAEKGGELAQEGQEEVGRRRDCKGEAEYVRRVEIPVVHVRQQEGDADDKDERPAEQGPVRDGAAAPPEPGEDGTVKL